MATILLDEQVFPPGPSLLLHTANLAAKVTTTSTAAAAELGSRSAEPDTTDTNRARQHKSPSPPNLTSSSPRNHFRSAALFEAANLEPHEARFRCRGEGRGLRAATPACAEHQGTEFPLSLEHNATTDVDAGQGTSTSVTGTLHGIRFEAPRARGLIKFCHLSPERDHDRHYRSITVEASTEEPDPSSTLAQHQVAQSLLAGSSNQQADGDTASHTRLQLRRGFSSPVRSRSLKYGQIGSGP